MYYLLEINIVDEKKHYLLNGVLYNNQKEEVTPIFDDGILHPNMYDPYTLILNDSESLTKNREFTDVISSFVIDAGFLFLVSPATQELFSKLIPDDIRMYEVGIKGNKFALDSYRIVKVLDKIDCVNLEESDIEYDEQYDTIDSAESIVLDEQKIPEGKKIFLLGKRASGIILVHEDLKKAIESANLTGFIFYPLEEAYMVIS
ncbi:MAG: hypothetical protein R2824_30655 [Saprospiraceae bacterium]|nr:hypothetical protein [Lewinella sp.]